jgi:EAL domain-containing protein (putative c-di-GMP-specific phosphodiesterase class I)
METALPAIAHGALRYLVKPVDTRELRAITATAVRLHRLARAKRKAIELAGRFALRLVYQPIVSWTRREVFGYEAFLRSNEPSLKHPGAILEAAEVGCCLPELGQRIRATACAAAPGLPGGSALFINLHVYDLLDDDLFDPARPLARMATRVVLEISERASLHDVPNLQPRIARLRAMGFRIAVDDLGAGNAGLTSFAQLQPEVVKLDVSLVRDVHAQPTKLALVRTMIAMCTQLGIQVVAEGVETPEERDAIVAAGCDLMQGFLFAKPGEAFPPALF